jgi:hypothetical protein
VASGRRVAERTPAARGRCDPSSIVDGLIGLQGNVALRHNVA